MARLGLKPDIFRPSASTIAAALCLALIVARMLRGSWFPPPIAQSGDYLVQRVERDGDLLLTTGQRVRLLGVRGPGSERDPQFEQEALAFLRSLVAGRRVTLELDRMRIDRQDRSLAYVSVGGLMLNEELIRRGYGTVDRRFPLQSEQLGLFEEAEEQARDAGAGIWSGH